MNNEVIPDTLEYNYIHYTELMPYKLLDMFIAVSYDIGIMKQSDLI